jgi:hypothetical protein
MAETKEEIIVSVKVDKGQTEQDINKLTIAVWNLRDANKELEERNRELAAQGKRNSEEYLENTKQIAKNKQAISENMSEQKNLIKSLNTESDSLGALKKANKDLIKERERLNLNTAEGKARLQEINKTLDENNNIIGQNISGQEKQKMGIGGVTEALNNMAPGLSGTITGIQGATKASLAFIATPLGAILAAIVVAFKLVQMWVERTTGGMDKFENITAAVSAVLDVVMDRLAMVGGALVKLFSGDPIGAFKDMKEAVSGIADEMEREMNAAYDLSKAIQALEDREIAYRVAMSESELQIKQLLIQAKNRTLSEQERIALLQQATDIEKKNNEELNAIKTENLRLIAEEAGATKNLYREANEGVKEYAQRLIESGQLTDENRDKVVEGLIALNEAQGESLALQEKIANQMDVLAEKHQEKLARDEENRQRVAEEAAEFEQWKVQMEIKLGINEEHNAKLRAAQEEKKRFHKEQMEMLGVNQKITIDIETVKDQVKKNIDASERKRVQDTWEFKKKLQAEELQLIGQTAQAGLQIISNISDQANKVRQMAYKNDMDALTLAENAKLKAIDDKVKKGLLTEDQAAKEKKKISEGFEAEQLKIKKKAFESNKKNQIVQTTIDAVMSAAAAFRALAGIPIVGPILGAVAAAAALVFGMKQVNEIKRSQFVGAQGGQVPRGIRWHTVGGKPHSQGGTKYYGDDGHQIELQKDEGMFIAKVEAHQEFLSSMSRRNQKHGGRSWFDSPVTYGAEGGQAAVSAGSNGGLTAQEVAEVVTAAIAAQPAPIVIVEDINNGQSRVAQVEANADLL